jgi:sortase A
MGKRSDRRKFRRRRRWAGFLSLVSIALLVFGGQFLVGMGTPDLQPAASRTAEKVGVERVESPDVAGAPEAVGKQTADEVALLAEEDEGKKTPAEKQEVDKEAAQKADEKQEAAKQQEQRSQKQDDPQQASVPDPPTNDLWFSIPALGLYDQYVTNATNLDFSAMDYGAIKLANSGYPWQKGANTYIAAHRLGWPGTASYHQFYNLPALQRGDIVYLGDANGTTYTYKVTNFKEIAPNQAAEVTGPQNGRDMVSLQTCIENYGDYWTMGPNWYVRYIVQADRVSVTPAK